jgi:gas vesicle protein
MRQFILGCLVGGIVMGGVSSLAGTDGLGRSPQQQQFDYFRQRQQQLDIQHMRRLMELQELDRKRNQKPC